MVIRMIIKMEKKMKMRINIATIHLCRVFKRNSHMDVRNSMTIMTTMGVLFMSISNTKVLVI